VRSIEEDWHTADLDEKRRAMLTYAEKLTRFPGDMKKTDIDAMRTVGFTDTDVLHITEVAAYYAYANRIADGLGIIDEDWYDQD
jgi:uncharacterized peroxidase-related enzyme